MGTLLYGRRHHRFKLASTLELTPQGGHYNDGNNCSYRYIPDNWVHRSLLTIIGYTDKMVTPITVNHDRLPIYTKTWLHKFSESDNILVLPTRWLHRLVKTIIGYTGKGLHRLVKRILIRKISKPLFWASEFALICPGRQKGHCYRN